jgi:hypothetical protein
MNTKIIDYKVASDTTPNGLASKIKKHLLEGWQPQGGIATAAESDGRRYYQALVRYQEAI